MVTVSTSSIAASTYIDNKLMLSSSVKDAASVMALLSAHHIGLTYIGRRR